MGLRARGRMKGQGKGEGTPEEDDDNADAKGGRMTINGHSLRRKGTGPLPEQAAHKMGSVNNADAKGGRMAKGGRL